MGGLLCGSGRQVKPWGQSLSWTHASFALGTLGRNEHADSAKASVHARAPTVRLCSTKGFITLEPHSQHGTARDRVECDLRCDAGDRVAVVLAEDVTDGGADQGPCRDSERHPRPRLRGLAVCNALAN